MRNSTLKRILGLVVLLALAGCAPLVRLEQPQQSSFSRLQAADDGGETLGQTLVATYSGLEGIALFMQPPSQAQGELVLHLRSDPQSTDDLRTARLDLAQVAQPGFYRFDFSPLPGSTQQNYYFFLELLGDGAVEVGQAAADAYLNGAQYAGHQPQEAQLTFRLIYDRQTALLGLAEEGLTWLGRLLAGAWLFILPGWGLLVWAWPARGSRHWTETLTIAGGLSLALYPLLFLLTDLVGLHLGRGYAWLLPLAGGAALLFWFYRSGGWQNLRRKPFLHPAFNGSALLANLALLGAIGLVFAVRFWSIRGLDVPLWGDSYQHTLIAQLLVDHGGLFDSWAPYTDLQTFTYHFGFHSLAAVFHWLTGLPLPEAVLWAGQILNGLAVVLLAGVAVRAGRSPWAGAVAVLVAGLLGPMPMSYLNWGRYTQLAGQAILPAAFYLAWYVLEAPPALPQPDRRPFWRSAVTPQAPWSVLVLAGLLFGGLALTHYRVLIFAGLAFGAFFVLFFRPGQARQFVLNSLWMAALAILLALPWLAHTASSQIMALFGQQVSTPPQQISDWTQTYNAIGDLFTYLPAYLWILLTLALAWGLWRREVSAALVGLWWLIVLLASNPQWLNLPGAGAISNFATFIAAYIPAGILLGAAAGWLVEDMCQTVARLSFWRAFRGRRLSANPAGLLVSLIAAGLILGAGLWGVRSRVHDLQVEQHALVTPPDLRAAAWVRANLPQNARFLVNSFFAYGGSAVVGGDAGWWLPLLAERQTTLPPLSYGLEREPFPGYSQWVIQPAQQIQAAGIGDPATVALLRERGVTHVYIGQRQGQVNNANGLRLEPEQLLASPDFVPVYHQDRVWIFALEPSGENP